MRGDSGRIVLEIEALKKEQLHSAVRRDGLTMKEWFVQQMDDYLSHSRAAEESGTYKTRQKSAQGKRSQAASKRGRPR